MMDEYTRFAAEEYDEYASHKLMAVGDMIHVEELFEDICGIILRP